MLVSVVQQSESAMLLFSCYDVYDSLGLRGLQHMRFPCPPLSPGVCSDPCPLSWWCYLTVPFSATPFSFCLHSFPASGSFPVSWLFPLSGQSKGALVSASVLPMNLQGWFPLGLTGLISLQSRGLSRIFSRTIWKHQFFSAQLSLWSNSHIRKNVRKKTYLWLYATLSAKCVAFLVCCLCLS